MTIRRRLSLAACLALVSFSAPWTDAADQEEPEQPATAAHRWLHDYYLKQASAYEFHYDDDKTSPLTFVDKPIFRWKQDDDWSGDVFVWTYKGRPEVVGCILSSAPDAGNRGVAHEFHTLSMRELPRTKTVSGSWRPKAVSKMIPFDEAPIAGETSTERMAQIRMLARRFTITMKNDDMNWELRWLPQPIYRYSSPETGVIDGGMFAYVWTRGTDPELLLLVECRDEKPKPRWYYLPVEFTSRPLSVKLKDREVWTTSGGGGWITGESSKPYETFYAGEVMVPTDNP